MAFLSSFDIAASGMSAQRLRMDIAAENIANIDTTSTRSASAFAVTFTASHCSVVV